MKQLFSSFKVIFLLLFSTILLSGCTIANYKSGILFSDKPIIGENFENKTFLKARERVYFGIFTKNGFKDDVIQYQLIKKSDKTEAGGLKIVYSKRAEVKHEHYFVDYVIPQEAGTYYIQAFELRNLQQPIVIGGFIVCE